MGGAGGASSAPHGDIVFYGLAEPVIYEQYDFYGLSFYGVSFYGIEVALTPHISFTKSTRLAFLRA